MNLLLGQANMAAPDGKRMWDDASSYLLAQLASLGIIIGTVFSYLPQMLAGAASVLVVAHYLVLLYESKTFSEMLARHRLKGEAQKAVAVVHASAVEASASLHTQAAEAATIVLEHAAAAAQQIKDTHVD